MPDLVNLNISSSSYFGFQRDVVLQWDRNIQCRFQEGIKRSRTLDIMVTGKIGSGKTTLIYGLFDRNVTKEESEVIDRGIAHVEAKEFSFNGTVAKIWDTPGLQDDTSMEDLYLYEMKKYCSNCNLYIYCINMSQRRLDASERRAMRNLTNTFGKDWWKKVLFVLTFANYEVGYCPAMCDLREYFERRMKACHDELTRMLVDLGVEQEIAEKVVVVPTGYSKPLAKYSYPSCWVLPGISNWLQNFWYKCAEVIDDRGFPAFVHVVINSHRLSVRDHITASGLARASAAARKSISISDFLPSLADVAASDAIGNVYIDPTAISLYWKYSKRFPFVTGELYIMK